MKNFLHRIWRFLKTYKYYLLTYIVCIAITIIGTYVYMNSAIEDSYKEIQDELSYGIFENKSTFGTRDRSYTIVSYHLSKIPEIGDFEDQSSYNQMYGGIDKFYSTENVFNQWDIYVYEKDGDRILKKEIQPYAVGISTESFYDNQPEELFRLMYNNIINDNDFNIDVNNENKIYKLKKLKTRFHKIDVDDITEFSGSLSDLSNIFWYEHFDNKMYSRIFCLNIYRIKPDYNNINLYYLGIPIVSIIIITILLILFAILLKKRKKKAKTKKIFNFGVTLNKSSEELNENFIDYEILLKKINPSNFISPYDSEKVKIANDLYSALLKANGNETIIAMIKEKAISDLKIEL